MWVIEATFHFYDRKVRSYYAGWWPGEWFTSRREDAAAFDSKDRAKAVLAQLDAAPYELRSGEFSRPTFKVVAVRRKL